jgi:hypothetical protein
MNSDQLELLYADVKSADEIYKRRYKEDMKFMLFILCIVFTTFLGTILLSILVSKN